MTRQRAAGILLHPTSLPGSFGIGDLGERAYAFIDFLVAAGQALWQVLPLGPTGYGDSPYACFSAFAGNPLLVDLHRLAAEGDLETAELNHTPQFPDDQVDFGPVIDFKSGLLDRAAARFGETASADRKSEFHAFCDESAHWLDDYALFRALKDDHVGAVWNTWDWPLASRQPDAIKQARSDLATDIFSHKYRQWQFFRQWADLKHYANEHAIRIVGDVPIFVAYDSADVWAHPELFHLDHHLTPTRVAGVPPDYFSPTGQLWGNPLYRWKSLARQDFRWWTDRIRQTLRTVDTIRLDHFRGFAAYWDIPAGEPTAVNGRWVKGPGKALFHALRNALGDVPIIAEDLGFITPDVRQLRDQLGLPGMNVLQFAFSTDPENTYLPHNVVPNSVVYTGTHDNDTTLGWQAACDKEERQRLEAYTGPITEPLNWLFIRMAYQTVCHTAIVPLQDVLGLDSDARMNAPGRFGGNWGWRFKPHDLTPQHAQRLLTLAIASARKKLPRPTDEEDPFADYHPAEEE